jgi:hypothetical protein
MPLQVKPFVLPCVLVIIADPARLTAPMAFTSSRVIPRSWQRLVKAPSRSSPLDRRPIIFLTSVTFRYIVNSFFAIAIYFAEK